MCNKISYNTKQQAVKHRDQLKRDPRTGVNKKLRPYPCNLCGKWHLTSASPNKSRIYRKRYRASKKEKELIREFKAITNNIDKYEWLHKHQGKWMDVYIGDVNYVIFNGRIRVVID